MVITIHTCINLITANLAKVENNFPSQNLNFKVIQRECVSDWENERERSKKHGPSAHLHVNADVTVGCELAV